MGVMFTRTSDDGYASWSYTGFSEFRDRLEAEDDGTLRPLLDQPDVEGTLTAEQCAVMEPALTRILDGWDGGTFDYDREHGHVVAQAMREGAQSGEGISWG